jgi:hypothetical protein
MFEKRLLTVFKNGNATDKQFRWKELDGGYLGYIRLCDKYRHEYVSKNANRRIYLDPFSPKGHENYSYSIHYG